MPEGPGPEEGMGAAWPPRASLPFPSRQQPQALGQPCADLAHAPFAGKKKKKKAKPGGVSRAAGMHVPGSTPWGSSLFPSLQPERPETILNPI